MSGQNRLWWSLSPVLMTARGAVSLPVLRRVAVKATGFQGR
ncbi:hypothetical protein [Erwinia tracheiphila]|nr:hypothetical protein [Erwinia tracheiphila]